MLYLIAVSSVLADQHSHGLFPCCCIKPERRTESVVIIAVLLRFRLHAGHAHVCGNMIGCSTGPTACLKRLAICKKQHEVMSLPVNP